LSGLATPLRCFPRPSVHRPQHGTHHLQPQRSAPGSAFCLCGAPSGGMPACC